MSLLACVRVLLLALGHAVTHLLDFVYDSDMVNRWANRVLGLREDRDGATGRITGLGRRNALEEGELIIGFGGAAGIRRPAEGVLVDLFCLFSQV